VGPVGVWPVQDEDVIAVFGHSGRQVLSGDRVTTLDVTRTARSCSDAKE
jgi:hypothetical protein